jgi:hypothetical protein
VGATGIKKKKKKKKKKEKEKEKWSSGLRYEMFSPA